MRRVATLLVLSMIATSCVMSARASREVVIGAVYPTSGGQGKGGIDELRGVRLAADYVNEHGGLGGARVRVRLRAADSSDAAPGAVRALVDEGISVIVGSHGSTIARPAAETAARAGVVFWETGAIGPLAMSESGTAAPTVFRFAPTGATLGRNAVAFAVEQHLPLLRHDPRALRYGSIYVDDAYGRSVGDAASAEVRRRGLTLATDIAYDLRRFDAASLARAVAAARVDVLFVAAYLDDGVAVRRELVRQKVPLVASVGTSSSYCMHEFGVALGRDAVGLYASDKPDGPFIDAERLDPKAAAALVWARARWHARYGDVMHAGALTGFAGTLALLQHVLPAARSMSPGAIADAARAADVPEGGLPNGGGLSFDASGDNTRATSVIWEWVKQGDRQVVWPPAFATHPIVPIEL